MKRTLLSCAAVAILASVVYANPLCTSNTIAYYMANYVDQTTACQVGDKLFFGFNYSGTAAGGAVAPTSSEVTVNGDPSNPQEPGLLFSSTGWTVSGTATLLNPLYIDSNITFTAAVASSLPLIIDASLDFSGQFSTTGQGVANIGETVLLGSGTGSIALAVDSNAGPFTDVKSFAPVSFVHVSKDLIVTVPRPFTGSNTGSATITSLREGFSEQTAPEPLSAVLFGSGLVALGLIRRRR
jgi:hypothetical protein